MNEITKPLFIPTFQGMNTFNYGNNSFANHQPLGSSLNTQLSTYIQPIYPLYPITHNGLETKVYESSNNAKKQGFSISDDFKEA